VKGVKQVGVGVFAYFLTFEVACLGWSSVDIFVFHNLDPKWGDELGNLQIAVQVSLYLGVVSGLAFLACLLASLGLWRVRARTIGLVGMSAGALSCVLAERQFGFWVRELFDLRGSSGIIVELGAPGLLTGVLSILAGALFVRRKGLRSAVA
jgi:hypothetical protein